MTYEVVFFYSKQKSGDYVKKCLTDIDVFVLDKLLGAGACANSLIDKTFFPLEHKFSSCLSSDPAYCLYMQPNISQRALWIEIVMWFQINIFFSFDSSKILLKVKFFYKAIWDCTHSSFFKLFFLHIF